MTAMKIIINATGSDTIRLWEWDGKHLSFKDYRNKSWVFVHGVEYDLDFLVSQLDRSIFRYSESFGNNVYGKIRGLRVEVYPSNMPDLIHAIETIGFGRKYSIYNADINPALRFMAETNRQFFPIESLYAYDPDIPTVSITGSAVHGKPETISINGKPEEKITPESLTDMVNAINYAVIIIYDNTDKLFENTLKIAHGLGLKLPFVRTFSAQTYESYGQTHYKNPRVSLSGKICISSDSFVYSESGLEGLMEVSRISGLPITTASVVTTGTSVSSLEETYAIKHNILIPLYKDDHENEKTIGTLYETDRGGMVLQPEPGVYSDVYEIDFSSMYPSIIVNYNLSPETMNLTSGFHVPDTPYSISTDRKGFLSRALGNLLETRLFYKSIKNLDPIYQKRDAALKWMLLTSFGYTGYKNAKFGKIEMHEAITAIGRWALMRAINLAKDHNFKIIHGIVDSLWLSGDGDIESLIADIARETRIKIVVDGHYRWIAFLPSRSGLGALNRYLGLRYDGSFKVRGIEARRSDVPYMAIKFQMDALNILRDCRTVNEVAKKRAEILNLETYYKNNLRSFPRNYYDINFHITKHFEDYISNTIQKRILKHVEVKGHEIWPGSTVKAAVVNKKMDIFDFGDNIYGDIDIKFYDRILSRAFEPINFLMDSVYGKTEFNILNKNNIFI